MGSQCSKAIISFLHVLSLLIFSTILFTQPLSAQVKPDLSTVKVDELSDQQVGAFVYELQKLGITDQQMDQQLQQMGMSTSNIQLLRRRMNAIRSQGSTAIQPAPKQGNSATTAQRQQLGDSLLGVQQAGKAQFDYVYEQLLTQNFGANVFQNRNLSFEPNIRLATPANYLLGPDDELLIDVSGFSEANYQLKISPEGNIRIPLVGNISVSGKTVEQAGQVIRQRLASTIYTNIKSGNTKVSTTLGAIRSIRVMVIGEATLPGTYTLPSLATVYHALYACGGPSKNGSYRNIELLRNNKVVATIDVYKFLTTGIKKEDIRLMDQDIIRISLYETRVELKGEVKKPGLFDVVKGEKLSDLIRYAGGYTEAAYTSKLQLYRNNEKEREVSTIANNAVTNFTPKAGDTYLVGRIMGRFSNRVNVSGAVYRPGDYELKEGMTLKQLIQSADGLRDDAFLKRAIIHRYKKDLSPEILSFSPEQIINGAAQDIVLQKEDRITIYSQLDLQQARFVAIEGEVMQPGTYLYEEGMRLQDLILMAGGLKASATEKRIEVARRMKQEDSTVRIKDNSTAIILQANISSSLSDSSQYQSFVLDAYDEVVVRKAPGYSEQKNVVIEGEVAYTGKYTLQTKTERISDLVKRAGGLTPFAYVSGAILIRTKRLSKTEQYNFEVGVNNLIKQNYQAGTPEALLQNQLNFAQNRTSENVGIDLEKILDNPGTDYDLLLNDGDTLRIPKQLQTVRVIGEVLYPTLVRYDEDFQFKDYINGAGGYSDRAAKKRAYVVNANGSARGTHSFLFVKDYPKIGPGAEIFVPVKREKEKLKTWELVSITASLATLVAVFFNVVK